LAAVSRKLEKPLAVMVQSSSAAGKSSLMEAVLKFVPEEERIQYSAMTGQSLFYLGEKDLKHKILAISEEEGAHSASYALKLLQSEGVVSIASTGKNATTGNLETQEYRVEGPVMLFSTTTAIDPDEELLNRCLVLSVDEGTEQTKAVHRQQRKRRTLEGFQASEDKHDLIHLHQNAQRLLRPLKIFNPYADQLTFVADKTRTRRDNEKYLALIDSIALLHQYQREVKRHTYKDKVMEYIDVTVEDIELANHLAHQVLGRTLDELPPQTRKLLKMVGDMVTRDCMKERIARSDYRFSRRQLREYCGWSDGQLKIHCVRLEEMEYLLVHSGSRGRSIEYELLFDGEVDSDERHLMGLIDTNALKSTYDSNKLGLSPQKLGQSTQKSAPSQGQVSPKLGGSQGEVITKNTEKTSVKVNSVEDVSKNALLEKINGNTSYTPNVLRESNTFPLAASLSSPSTDSHNPIEV
jgi:DNA primase